MRRIGRSAGLWRTRVDSQILLKSGSSSRTNLSGGSVSHVRLTRGTLPVFRPVGFPGRLPNPACQSSRHRALRKSVEGLSWFIPWLAMVPGWLLPGSGSAWCLHLGRVKQRDLGGDRPPSAVAVAAADGLHGDPAVFAPCPAQESAQSVAGQEPPPHPAASSWQRACPPPGRLPGGQGGRGWFPRSPDHRSARPALSYPPAASPRLRRRPSTWPPHRLLLTASARIPQLHQFQQVRSLRCT